MSEEDGVEIKTNDRGDKLWYQYGVLHRDDGPAVERPNGDKHWYQYGQEHREDGPAIEYASGARQWFFQGKCHRRDGPAFEDPKEPHRNEYWLNGERWHDGASVIAREKAEKARLSKSRLPPGPNGP